MFRIASGLERFEVGDNGVYIHDQQMFKDYPKTSSVDEITQEEARELCKSIGTSLNNNKEFICVEKNDEEIVFVYWHDFRFERRTYSMQVNMERVS